MRDVLLALLTAMTLTAGEIDIAVAANVSYAIDELKAEFAKTSPEIEVRITLGSSGKLTAQIKNGAPYGMFMAANMAYPQTLYDEKLAITRPIVYAEGALAYFSVTPRDFTKGIRLLEESAIKRIAIANPKTAPYGKAALEAIAHAERYDALKAKFVYAESISQTVSYAMTAADIGIVAKSLLYSPKMARFQQDRQWAAVDPSLYTPIKQGIVLLREAEGDTAYRAFYDFMLSDKAKSILMRYGYIVR